MTTIDWLADRIREGQALLERLTELSAGPARRSDDVARPELVDVRAFLTDYSRWDGENSAGLAAAFPGQMAWLEQYRSIEPVDRQRTITDFSSVKGRLHATVASKVEELRSIRDCAVRRIVSRPPATPRVFLGHGPSQAWRELKDYLEQALGLAIHERIDATLDGCAFAILVMTGEDLHLDGSAHARENVIHEIGLFQGRLGWSRVIVLLEEGCAEFSNLEGIVHVPFPKGNLRAAFEDVRRALAREGLTSRRFHMA
jgi:predicted nucleotide-binding protein